MHDTFEYFTKILSTRSESKFSQDSGAFPEGLPLSLSDQSTIEKQLERLFNRKSKDIAQDVKKIRGIKSAIRQGAHGSSRSDLLGSFYSSTELRRELADRLWDATRVIVLERAILTAYWKEIGKPTLKNRSTEIPFRSWPATAPGFIPNGTFFSELQTTAAILVDDIARWRYLPPAKQDIIEQTVFAIGSILNKPDILIESCILEPELAYRFNSLAWHPSRRDERGKLVIPTMTQFLEEVSSTTPTASDVAVTDAVRLFKESLLSIRKHRECSSPYYLKTIRDVLKEFLRESEGYYHVATEGTKAQLTSIIVEIYSEIKVRAQTLAQYGITVELDLDAHRERVFAFLDNKDDDRLLDSIMDASNWGIPCENLVSSIDKGISSLKLLDERLRELASDGVAGNPAQLIEVANQIKDAKEKIQNDLNDLAQLFNDHSFIEDTLSLPGPAQSADSQGTESLQHSPDEFRALELLLDECERERDSLKNELDLQSERRFAAEQQLQFFRQAQGEAYTLESCTVYEGLEQLAKSATPSQILSVAAKLFEGRLVVLPSAYASADESARFRNGDMLFRGLKSLAVEYRDLLLDGRPDSEARHALGGGYRAGESETVKNNSKLREPRKFVYKGDRIPMYQHLAFGIAENVETTLRVHFVWDAEDKVIAVGYVGPHLPLR